MSSNRFRRTLVTCTNGLCLAKDKLLFLPAVFLLINSSRVTKNIVDHDQLVCKSVTIHPCVLDSVINFVCVCVLCV